MGIHGVCVCVCGGGGGGQGNRVHLHLLSDMSLIVCLKERKLGRGNEKYSLHYLPLCKMGMCMDTITYG